MASLVYSISVRHGQSAIVEILHPPSQPLPLRLKNLHRAELLVALWHAFDQRYAEAVGIGDANAATT
jgi:hypothetical protein